MHGISELAQKTDEQKENIAQPPDFSRARGVQAARRDKPRGQRSNFLKAFHKKKFLKVRFRRVLDVGYLRATWKQ